MKRKYEITLTSGYLQRTPRTLVGLNTHKHIKGSEKSGIKVNSPLLNPVFPKCYLSMTPFPWKIYEQPVDHMLGMADPA